MIIFCSYLLICYIKCYLSSCKSWSTSAIYKCPWIYVAVWMTYWCRISISIICLTSTIVNIWMSFGNRICGVKWRTVKWLLNDGERIIERKSTWWRRLTSHTHLYRCAWVRLISPTNHFILFETNRWLILGCCWISKGYIWMLCHCVCTYCHSKSTIKQRWMASVRNFCKEVSSYLLYICRISIWNNQRINNDICVCTITINSVLSYWKLFSKCLSRSTPIIYWAFYSDLSWVAINKRCQWNYTYRLWWRCNIKWWNDISGRNCSSLSIINITNKVAAWIIVYLSLCCIRLPIEDISKWWYFGLRSWWAHIIVISCCCVKTCI